MRDDSIRIAVLTRTFSVGGAERVAANIASALSKAGYAVDAYCLNKRSVDYSIDDSVQIFGPVNESIKAIGILKRIIVLAKIFHSSEYDLVIDFSLSYKYLKLLGMRKGMKYLVSERNYPNSHYSEKQLHQVLDIYERADMVVFQTEEEAACFANLNQSKIRIIPNAVIDGMLPSDDEKRDTVVTAARLSPQKNLSMMIDAFELFSKKYPGYLLLIFGDGEEKSKLEGEIATKGLCNSVKILPHTKDIHDEMRRSKIFLSTSNYEGIQNSLLEAITLGIPCVATNCLGGGVKLLMSKFSSNWLVQVNDYESMANKMIEIIDDYDSSLNIAKSESEYVREAFNADIIYGKWVSYVNSLWDEGAAL